MVKTIKGKAAGRDINIGIVASQFNEIITQRLLDGCLKELSRLGVKTNHITITWVPGSLEVPVTALKLARKKTIQAVICLGAVLKGETLHFELVAKGAARGIAQVALETGKPIIFGILATNTVNQAYKRSQAKGDNKGVDAAKAAVEMANLLSQL